MKKQDKEQAPPVVPVEIEELPEMVLCYDPHEGNVIRPRKRPAKKEEVTQ